MTFELIFVIEKTIKADGLDSMDHFSNEVTGFLNGQTLFL